MADSVSLMNLNNGETRGSSALLMNALNMTVKKCVSSLKYSSFAVNYPAVHLHDSALLKHIHKEMVAKLQENIYDELKLMISEEKINPLLAELDILRKAVPMNCKVSWRPTGNPENDSRVHIMKQKIEQKLLLKKLLLQEVQKYTQLKNDITLKRASLNDVQNHLEIIQENLAQISEEYPPPAIHQVENKVKTILLKEKECNSQQSIFV